MEGHVSNVKSATGGTLGSHRSWKGLGVTEQRPHTPATPGAMGSETLMPTLSCQAREVDTGKEKGSPCKGKSFIVLMSWERQQVTSVSDGLQLEFSGYG